MFKFQPEEFIIFMILLPSKANFLVVKLSVSLIILENIFWRVRIFIKSYYKMFVQIRCVHTISPEIYTSSLFKNLHEGFLILYSDKVTLFTSTHTIFFKFSKFHLKLFSLIKLNLYEMRLNVTNSI